MRRSLACMVLLLLVVCLLLSSCGLLWNPYIKAHFEIGENVKYVENAMVPTLLYEGKNYILEPNGWFNGVYGQEHEFETVTKFSEDITLGIRFAFHSELFYSYTYEDPLYIYSTSCEAFFFREDFDPTADAFVIEGTAATIPFSSIIAEPVEGLGPYRSVLDVEDAIVYLRSVAHPDIGVELNLYFIEGEWCWTGGWPAWLWWDIGRADTKWYRVTDELLALLEANELLPAPPAEP